MSTFQPRVPRGVRTGGRYAPVPRPEAQGVLFGVQRDGTPTQAPPQLRAIGFNDEQTDCDACGRRELRGTVVLADDDGVEVARMGTTCASRALGHSVARNDVVAAEKVRRAEVSSMLRAGMAHLRSGHLAAAAMEVRDSRRRGLHLPDELEVAARLEHDIEAERRRRPERWAYEITGRAPVELDTRDEAAEFVQRLSRHGARLVRLDRHGRPAQAY